MTKPRTLGYLAVRLAEESSNKLSENQSQLFDVVAAIHAGDKKLAISLLQKISDRNSAVSRALFLMGAQDLHGAAEALAEIMPSDRQLLDRGK